MQLSEKTIKFLSKAICGDHRITPYKTGPQLVKLFNLYGSTDQYGQGFPSRWEYTENKLREYNGSSSLKAIIEDVFDPRDFLDTNLNIEKSITETNKFLAFDRYQLVRQGQLYKMTSETGLLVDSEATSTLNHEFVNEQIDKCRSKISEGDYNGAITNARSLAEAVMIEIIEDHLGKEIKNDGKLDNLYKQVKKILKLNSDPNKFPATVLQLLSGLESITSGLAGLSNNSGDRHATKFKTHKHHAQLAVNATMTLVDFLLESREYQKTIKAERSQ